MQFLIPPSTLRCPKRPNAMPFPAILRTSTPLTNLGSTVYRTSTGGRAVRETACRFKVDHLPPRHRRIQRRSNQGKCRLPDRLCSLHTHRLKIYLGAYSWPFDGADAIIFTDDIGLKSWKLRERACSGVENLGSILDIEANKRAPEDQATRISSSVSRTQIWIAPTDEEQVILIEILKQLRLVCYSESGLA